VTGQGAFILNQGNTPFTSSGSTLPPTPGNYRYNA
jgi:hypothetical protein